MSKPKKYTIWIIILLVIGAGGYFFLRPKAPVTVYTTADVTRGNLAQTVSVTGTLNPEEQINLTFKTTGILKSINVDVDDQVKKGQKLATIDTGSLLSQLKQAEEEVTVQKETLDDMKKRDDTYNHEQRQAQRANIKSSEAAVNAILDQLKDVNMISSIDGIVIRRTADPGETVVLSLNSPVLTIAKNNDLIIESNVPESDILKLVIGQKTSVTLDALTAQDKFDATVYKIDPASTVIQDVVYYRIKLKFNNLDPRFKAGMSANVDIHTAEADNVLMIPMRAVQTEGNNKFVEVLDPDGKTTTKIQIQAGLEGDEGMVEVKSGLSEGQKVVTFTKTQ
ncbi:MAG: efflux RND transporter periplasmic adaptor subunit [Candidatus Moranbacteria bacterium]|nr:efflux RND transporter periplasmic adaptor subunit [Candidatus Moranbacteria bacterium]